MFDSLRARSISYVTRDVTQGVRPLRNVALRKFPVDWIGLDWFWYKDKVLKQIVTVSCTIAEFIDRWAQHIPKRYCHAVRYCGILAPRRWNQVVDAVFSLSGQRRPQKARQVPWNLSVRRMSGRDPLKDSQGCEMRFLKHRPPSVA